MHIELKLRARNVARLRTNESMKDDIIIRSATSADLTSINAIFN